MALDLTFQESSHQARLQPAFLHGHMSLLEEEQSKQWHRGAEKFRKHYPADYEKCFAGSVMSDEELAARMAAEKEFSHPPEPLSLFFLPSSALSFSSLSCDLDSAITPDDHPQSNNSSYCPQLGFDIDADGILADEVIMHFNISRRRWSADDYIAHDGCTLITDYAH